MADKLHTLTSNLIKFAAGEKPSADKFNAANEYFSRSLREISRAIGDIRDQGYPHSSDANKYTHLTGAWNPYEAGREEGRPLDIVNIARLIGPASNLNPKMLDFETTKVEIVDGSLMEYELSYPLKTNGSITIYNEGLFETLVKVENFFTGERQFLVKENVVKFSSTSIAGRAIVYETSISGIDGGANYNGASFNVIPDPNQPIKLSIIPLQNEINAYSVDFGLCTHQQSGIKTKESLKLSSLNAGEYNNNLPLKLPTWMWSGENPRFENGDAIPEGFLVLKNLTTNEVYQNASYFFISPTEIHVKGISLCVDHEFCVITVGTDITTSIDDLRNKMFLHKHDGSFGEPKVSVRDLVEKFSEYSAIVYGESSIPNNHFPMYLHRSGYDIDTNLNNGNNAMLGALMMGSAAFNSLNAENFPPVTPSPTTIDSLGHGSQAIFFSSFDCYLAREDNGTLLLKNSNYKNIDIEARNLNLTSTAEIILNAPGGLSLLSQADNNFSYLSINTTGPVFNQAGTFNRITAGTDINITAGETVEIRGKNIKNEIDYNINPAEWGYFSVEGNGTNSELFVVPLGSGVFIGGDEIEFYNNYNKKDNLNDRVHYKSFETGFITRGRSPDNYIKQETISYLNSTSTSPIVMGKLIKSNESIELRESFYGGIGIEEILPAAIDYFSPALLNTEDSYSQNIFYNLKNNNNYLNFYYLSEPFGLDDIEIVKFKYFKFNENLKLISTSPITDSWNQQARFFEFQINTEDTLIEIDRKVDLLPLDNGYDLFGILGNSHFCFNLNAMGYLCKKRIYIKKDANKLPINLDTHDFQSLQADTIAALSDAHAYNIINYSIKLAGRKFINFKLNCYITTSNSATQVLSRVATRVVVYSSDIDSIDFLELTKQALIPDYDDTNQYDLVKSVLIYHYLNDIDFKVEIIEDFNDFIINITGSCFDWKPFTYPYL